jgi:hypothetical protein
MGQRAVRLMGTPFEGKPSVDHGTALDHRRVDATADDEIGRKAGGEADSAPLLPTERSKTTSQTSPRRGEVLSTAFGLVGDARHRPLAPRCRRGLARLVGRLGCVAGGEVLANDVRTGEVVEQAADAAAADHAVQERSHLDFGHFRVVRRWLS